MTDQKGNGLYHDLVSNTPGSVTMELPEELGTGTISQLVTKQNVVFSSWKIKYKNDRNVDGVTGEDFVQILFCLGEGMTLTLDGEKDPVMPGKGEALILYNQGKLEHVCFRKNVTYVFRSVRIPMACFRKLLHDFFQESEIRAYEEKLMAGYVSVTITPYMEHILNELSESEKLKGGLGYLFLESKMMELLSIFLSAILEHSVLPEVRVRIPEKDQKAVADARRIIDSSLADAPGCEELAKEVCLSVSSLTKGFAAMYGMPVHAYIIDQRLKKASVLLMESNFSITQIAALVGYPKTSNFSAAFKKKFGVLPKDYKGENTIW